MAEAVGWEKNMLDRYKTDPSNRTPALPVILAPQPRRDSFKVTTGS